DVDGAPAPGAKKEARPPKTAPPSAVRCAPYAVRRTLCAVRCAPYAVRRTLCAVRCALYAVRRTLCAVRCAPYAVRCALCAVRCTLPLTDPALLRPHAHGLPDRTPRRG